ncbi:hypothetical protein BO82DRAFT_410118, partial [Aspergillus uvarum CBS 121591]
SKANRRTSNHHRINQNPPHPALRIIILHRRQPLLDRLHRLRRGAPLPPAAVDHLQPTGIRVRVRVHQAVHLPTTTTTAGDCIVIRLQQLSVEAHLVGPEDGAAEPPRPRVGPAVAQQAHPAVELGPGARPAFRGMQRGGRGGAHDQPDDGLAGPGVEEGPPLRVAGHLQVLHAGGAAGAGAPGG